MNKNIVVCYDFRNTLSGVATVDSRIWSQTDKPPIELIGRGFDLYPWMLCDGYYENMPMELIKNKFSSEFCINAYCIHEKALARLKKWYGSLEKAYYHYGMRNNNMTIENLTKNGWKSLGFDISWALIGVSSIYTTHEMEFAKYDYKNIWNQWGLINNESIADALIDNPKFKPHDPTIFIPIEILTNNFCTVNKSYL